MKHYTLGLVFNFELSNVLLIEKNGGPFPGKLNGLGGSIEPMDEGLNEAMIRELSEETNGSISREDIHDMKYFLTLAYRLTDIAVHCFAIRLRPDSTFSGCSNYEGIVEWHPITYYLWDLNHPRLAGGGNLPYLIKESLGVLTQNTSCIASY